MTALQMVTSARPELSELEASIAEIEVTLGDADEATLARYGALRERFEFLGGYER